MKDEVPLLAGWLRALDPNNPHDFIGAARALWRRCADRLEAQAALIEQLSASERYYRELSQRYNALLASYEKQLCGPAVAAGEPSGETMIRPPHFE